MAQTNNSSAEKKLSLLKEVFQNIKNDRVVWDPAIKAAEKYSQALRTLSIASRQFYEVLGKIGEQAAHANGGTNDLGVGIQTIAEHFKQLENKREAMIKSLIEDLSNPLDRSLETWKKDASNLEKEYQKDSKKLSSEIKDAEKDSQKAGKKNPQDLKKAIEALNSKVKDMETLRQNTLRNAIIEERKRYCFFIMHFATVIGHEMAMHDQAVNNIKTQIPQWTQLAVSPEQLPPEIEQLVEIQQRTFVSVQAEGNINISSYYDDSESDLIRTASFSSTDSTIRSTASNDDTIRIGDQVKAIYSYQGDADKLSFKEGDTITVTEVDPSGWCLGELRGQSGWFPSNYVEKIKRAPSFTPAPPPSSFSVPSYSAPQAAYSAPSPPQPAFYSAPPPPQLTSYSAPPPPQPTSYSAPPPPQAASYSAPPPQAAYVPPPPSKNLKAAAPPPPAPKMGGGAPPPPPMGGGGAPPPPAPPPVSGGGGDRGALLSSIQSGARLKKTVTNDRSAPKFK